jgi:hypothetical protein
MTVNGEQEMSPLPDTFFSQVDEAKQRAARLAARSDALTNATKKRDDTLFALFRHLHALDNELRKLVHRFQSSNHIRRLDRVCKTTCGRPGPD